MKILYDHQTFSQQMYGGISRYFCELITGINKTGEHNAYLSLLWSNNVHLREYNMQVPSYPFPKRNGFLYTSNQLINYKDILLGRYDIYHATYFDDFLTNCIKNKPLVFTFYDMIYERLSHQFMELSSDKLIVGRKKKVAKQASHLIAISESTKQDMIELLDVAPEKISVVHLSSSFLPRIKSRTVENKSDRPYLLYVGNRKGYKNFTFFLNAVSSLLKRYSIALVCAGGGTFDHEEQTYIRARSLEEFVEHRRIDNDQMLQDLYEAAEAFVFPSLYEGFGIPVVEAFACGCPCVISNTSSLPEVAGQAALYFEPSSEESIRQAVERVLTDKGLRDMLVTEGTKRLALFSWERTIAQTLAVYKKCL